MDTTMSNPIKKIIEELSQETKNELILEMVDEADENLLSMMKTMLEADMLEWEAYKERMDAHQGEIMRRILDRMNQLRYLNELTR